MGATKWLVKFLHFLERQKAVVQIINSGTSKTECIMALLSNHLNLNEILPMGPVRPE